MSSVTEIDPVTEIDFGTCLTPSNTVVLKPAYDVTLGLEVALTLRCARVFQGAQSRDEIRELLLRGLDWDYLLQFANYHGVLELLSKTLNTYFASDVPAVILERLKAQSLANARQNLHMARALIKIVSLFESRSVPIVPFKGPMLAATAYGNLSLRQFCDLDILVPVQDVLKATELLIENGYRLELPDESVEIAKLIGRKKDFRFVSADRRVVVELHWRLAGKHFYFPYNMDQLWMRLERISFSGTAVLNIPPEDLLVILCAHGSKHLWSRLLWICDINELIRSNPRIDWERIIRTSQKCGSQRMLLLGLHLANSLLGTALPSEVLGAITEDTAIEPIAQELLSLAFPGSECPKGHVEHHSPVLYPFFIRMRERLREKAKLGFQYFKAILWAAVTPSASDREFFALPSAVSFLYYVLRPFRVIGRSAFTHPILITNTTNAFDPYPSKEMKRALVAMIAALPFKRQLFNAMRSLRPPKKVYQYLRHEGSFSVRIDNQHSFLMQHHGYGVETDLFWKGLMNGNHGEALSLWIKLCASASTIFDIGANLGLFSLVAKAINPKARVVGFEPISHLEEKFKANCDLNRFDIQCQQVALSNTDCEQEIFFAPGHILTASLQSHSSRTQKEQIKSLQLTTFIEDHKINRVDLMKIDVESYEPQVLEGMGHYLATMRPTMIIEILNDEIGSRVESVVGSCPYLFFCLDEHIGAVRQDHLTVQGRDRHSRNFLLCEKGTAAALDLL